MATLTAQPALRERGRWWRRAFFYLAIILVLVLIGTLGSLYRLVHAPLPQLDGAAAVPGLASEVHVIRDGHGVPTIEASNLEDLFFAQGYVTAQDRLWQMDVMKRFAAGEIAEILGPDLLAHDREQRILGLRAAAKNALEKLPAREKNFL
jgi:penicillin amidase